METPIKKEKLDLDEKPSCPRPPVFEANDLKQFVSSIPKIAEADVTIKSELFNNETNFDIDSKSFGDVQIKKEDIEELTSPIKMEYDDSSPRKSFKSAKISYKKRDSPYKTVFDRLGTRPAVSSLNINDETQNKK